MATTKVSKKLKMGRRDASRRGRATKDSEEMKLLRKKSDSKKTGIRKTRKQRDVANKRTAARKTTKQPRRAGMSASVKNPKTDPGGQEYLPGDPRRGGNP
jgi:protein required for attachment to host cells